MDSFSILIKNKKEVKKLMTDSDFDISAIAMTVLAVVIAIFLYDRLLAKEVVA